MTNEQKIKRIEEILDELFDTANSYAGTETGHIAVELHKGCNGIMQALKFLKEGATQEDKNNQLRDWMINNIPLELLVRP